MAQPGERVLLATARENFSLSHDSHCEQSRDAYRLLINAPEVQVHEVRKIGIDEYLVLLCLRNGIPSENECSQAREPAQVDDLGGGKQSRYAFLAATDLEPHTAPASLCTLPESTAWPGRLPYVASEPDFSPESSHKL